MPSPASTRNRHLKRLFPPAAGLLLCSAALLTLAMSAGMGKKGPKDTDTADIGKASIASFDITTLASGELEAKNQIEIRSKLTIRSSIVTLVDEGTRVKKGDLLIKLNSDDIETRVSEEEARVETARAELVSAQNAVQIQEIENASRTRKAMLKLRLAELSLDQWLKGELVEKTVTNTLSVENSQRELRRLEKKFKNSRLLLEQKFISQDEYDRDEIALAKARADYERARVQKESYDNYQIKKDRETKESDAREAKAELSVVEKKNEAELASKKAALKNRQRQLSSRETSLDRYQKQLEATRIIAPSDGLVVYATSLQRSRFSFGGDGALQIGRQCNPNELLIALPDTSEMVASVSVHESLASRIKPGQTASVRIEAAGNQTFQGTVQSIGVLAESGGWRDPNLREYTVKIALNMPEDNPQLKPSMRCEAQILMNRVTDALTVPVQAVFNQGPVRFVYQPKGSKFVKLPVKVGRRSSTYAEISAGIEKGQRVLLREPSPGEVLATAWKSDQLKAVGLMLDPAGNPVPIPRKKRSITKSSPNKPSAQPVSNNQTRPAKRHTKPTN